MIRLVVALLGLGVIGAVFVGVYYASPEGTRKPPYNLAPGEVESDQLQPAGKGEVIELGIQVTGGPIDVYIMEAAQAQLLVEGGAMHLDRPFSYRSSLSRLNVTGHTVVTIVSDGETPLSVILDNSDNYYNDTVPQGDASVRLVTRYPAEENRNLLLGYLAAMPSVLLVALTLWRKQKRARKQPRET